MSEVFNYRGSDFGPNPDPFFADPALGFDPPGKPVKPIIAVGTVLTAFALLTSGRGGGPSSSRVEAIANPTPVVVPLPSCSGCEANETGDPRKGAGTPIPPLPTSANSGGIPDCGKPNQGMPYEDSGGKVYQCNDGNWKEAHSNIGSDGSFADPNLGKFKITNFPKDLKYAETLQARVMEVRFNTETGKIEYLVEVYGSDGIGIFTAVPIK